MGKLLGGAVPVRRRIADDGRLGRRPPSAGNGRVGRAIKGEEEVGSSFSLLSFVLNLSDFGGGSASKSGTGGGGFLKAALTRSTRSAGESTSSRWSWSVPGVGRTSPFPRMTPLIAEPKSSDRRCGTGVSKLGMGGRTIELVRVWCVGGLCRTGVASSLIHHEYGDEYQALKHGTYVISPSVVIDEAIDDGLRE